MSQRKLLRVFEYEALDFEEPAALTWPQLERFAFSDRYREALYAYHTRSNGQFYSLQNHGIKFRQFVGVIQILDLTIEILPKIDRQDRGTLREPDWHGVLLDMLTACKRLKPKTLQRAGLKLRPNSILEIYISLYLDELEQLLHSGLIKKYRKQQDNLFALKGALLFNRNIRENIVHAERFYTRHFVYDRHHELHQLLYQGIEVCDHLVHSGLLKDRIKRLQDQWPQSRRVIVVPSLFERFQSDRKTKDYTEAIAIARLLLLNYHPDIQSGREPVFALLFDMNKLWEEYINRLLQELQTDFNFTLYSQSVVDFWKAPETNTGKTVRPDLVVEYAEEKTHKRMVIDTKWKCPEDDQPADDDLKQMLIYKLYYHADMVILLYPSCDRTWTQAGLFENAVHSTAFLEGRVALKMDLARHCNLSFLNLISSTGCLKKSEQLAESLVQLGIIARKA